MHAANGGNEGNETKAERDFDELYVRAETGLGAEVAIPTDGAGRPPAREEAEREPAGVR